MKYKKNEYFLTVNFDAYLIFSKKLNFIRYQLGIPYLFY